MVLNYIVKSNWKHKYSWFVNVYVYWYITETVLLNHKDITIQVDDPVEDQIIYPCGRVGLHIFVRHPHSFFQYIVKSLI